MGILTRIRRRSSSAAQTQRPSSASPLASHLPSATPSTATVAPDPPSTGSVGSRIPKRPWKKKHDERSFTGSLDKKEKGKTKAEDDALLGGPKYGNFSPSLGPTSSLSVSNSQTINTSGLSSQLSSSPPPNGSPAGDSNFVPGSNEKIKKRRPEVSKIKRPASRAFKQDGGILGKLNSEVAGAKQRKASGSSWMNGVESIMSSDPPSEWPNTSMSNPNFSSESKPVATSSSRAITPDLNGDQRLMPTLSRGSKREEDPIEVLESVEKKHRFWKGKGKPNRHSRVMSDSFQLDRSESPTPPGKIPSSSSGQDLASVSRNSVDLDQSHSQQLRRLSSSFFPNPFYRSLSRASERPSTVEDGSFQLKGFRHVSGMSDVEGAGKLEGYLSHVKRESVAALSIEQPATLTSPNSPLAYASPKPTAISLSRPVSVAPSLTSVEDMLVSPNKVSVAAFKKGLRRPSNGLTSTMSDIGHETLATGSGDEDDDIPLGKRIVSQPLPRQTSSQSLFSMRDASLSNPEGATSNPMLKQPGKEKSEKEVSNQEPLVFQVKTYRRTSSGFVVKSRSPMASNQDLPSSPVSSLNSLAAGFSGSLRPTALTSSASTRAPSPNVEATNLYEASPITDDKELMADGYFSAVAPSSDQVVQKGQEPPSPVISQPTEELAKVALISPLTTARQPPVAPIAGLPTNAQSSNSPSKRHTPPPVRHIDVPRPLHDISSTLLALNLPLPPDQMPDTPPKGPVPLPEQPRRLGTSPEGSASPSTQRKRMSLLEEPMKYLSGIWATPSTGEDGFDPMLAVNSLKRSSGDEPQSPTRLNRPDITSWCAPQIFPEHQTTASPPPFSSAERIRSPLSDRFAGVTTSAITTTKTGGGLQKPVMEKLKANAEDLRNADNHKSPVSDSTLAPIPRPFSSFIKSGPVQSNSVIDESESDTEGGTSVSNHHREGLRASSLSSQQSLRRVPGGPRQPMRQSRIASMPITNSHLVRKSPDYRRHAGKDDNEDEPLAKIKHRSSKSSLAMATAGKSPPYGRISLPTPPTSVSNISIGSSSPQERRKPLIELEAAAPATPQSMTTPRPHDSLLPALSRPFDISSTTSTSSTPSSGKKSLPSPVRAQVRFDSPETKRPSGIQRKTTSPEISEGSVNDSVVEVYGEWQRRQAEGRNSDDRQRRRSEGALQHPSPYDPPVQAQMGVQEMQNSQDMSPEAFFAWQKHQWQMQYLAAAYRASEEEWEKQSSVSMSINNQPSHQFDPFPMQHMPMFPSNVNMMNMGMSMPMGYGYPAYPQLQGNMFNPYLSLSQMQNQLDGGGRYSYGTGAQSVFGGEFGPPSAKPSQQQQYNPPRRASSDQQGAHYGNPPQSDRHQNDRRLAKGRSASALGVHDNPTSPPTMSKRPSGVFKGLLGEREKVELQQEMERQAQEKLEKQKQWAKERARGKTIESSSPPPPSSWRSTIGDWSEGATSGRQSRSRPTIAN
ncbi:hypothetical protein AYX15_05658 [Cryptococcus neoformans]|nr:hypothetical protein AYX15_05658 [Cryptococcus neoformans var. grubii]